VRDVVILYARAVCLVIFSMLMFPLSTLADPTADSSSASEVTSAAPIDRLAQYITVRKSFTGTTKDANAPATIVVETASPGSSDTAVDIGVKGKLPDFGTDPFTLNLSPAIEWHKSTLEENPVDKLSIDATLFVARFLSTFNDYIGSDLKYKIARDFVLDNNPNSIVWRIFYHTGERPGPWPGLHLKLNGEELFYYLPSIGIEHYSKLALKEQQFGQSVQLAPPVSGSFYALALNFFLNPFPATFNEQLSIIGTITQRIRFAGDPSIPKDSTLSQLSLTYFFDRSRNYGFGVDYQNGRDPDRNFVAQTRTSIGLKFQIGK